MGAKFTERKYLIDNKRLMAEWDWDNNDKLGLDPAKLSEKSGKKAHWICNKGHKWPTSICHRFYGTGCPYCSGHLPIENETDLATIRPDLAEEWNYEKNEGLKNKKGEDISTPNKVTASSGQKVWWKCKQGHEWQSTVRNRTSGNGCPHCWNEYHTSFPEQAIFFYMNKHFKTKSRELVNGYEVDIYLPDIHCGIEYDGEYFHSKRAHKEQEKDTALRNAGIRIIRVKESNKNEICNNIIYYMYNAKHSNLGWVISALFDIFGAKIDTAINVENDRPAIYDLYIHTEKEQSLGTKYPWLVDEWDYEKNGNLTPYMVRPASNKTVGWMCINNHEWDATISHRANGDGCPICSGRRALAGVSDLETLYPELALEWDYTENGNLLPSLVRPKSGKVVGWVCSENHKYKSRIASRVDGNGCPYCAGKKVARGEKDLQTLNPELIKEWDWEQNYPLLPSMFTRRSGKKVSWKCNICGNKWDATIDHRSAGRGCPECAKKKRVETRRATMQNRKINIDLNE